MSGRAAMHVIGGDIGGTKSLIQLVAFDPAAPHPQGEVCFEQRFNSRAYPDLRTILREFLGAAPKIGQLHGACLGVAGPVQGDAKHQFAQLTNLPWRPDSRALAEVLATPRVRLINDFQAIGYGIDALSADDFATLQPAENRPHAPRLILGAGTGLGVALMFWHGSHYECYPTEGGHVHFAPVDAEQGRLLEFLRPRFGRVSNERLVSGPGLVDIYRFLLHEAGQDAEGDPLLAAPDPAAAIAADADRGAPRARHALDLFVALYGQVAGDLALSCLAEGGVYIAGGIAPKILHFLDSGRFVSAFNDKGRMRPLVERMPVRVILNTRVAMVGAALAASRL